MTATLSLHRWRRRIVWPRRRPTRNVPWDTEMLFYRLRYQQVVRVLFDRSLLLFSFVMSPCRSRVDWLFHAPFAVFTRARLFLYLRSRSAIILCVRSDHFSRTLFICVLAFAFGGILCRVLLLQPLLHALFIPVFASGFAHNYYWHVRAVPIPMTHYYNIVTQ